VANAARQARPDHAAAAVVTAGLEELMAYEDDWVMGDLLDPNQYGQAPLRITVGPRPQPVEDNAPPAWGNGAVPRQLPPEFALPPEAERPGIVERSLPKVYTPEQQQQQDVAKAALNLTPIGSIADMWDAPSPLHFGVAAAGLVPGARAAKVAGKAAERVAGFAPGALAEPLRMPDIPKLAKPLFDAYGQPIKGAAFTKQSRAILDEIAAGPKGAGPMDLSGPLRSDVPQVAMERYVPKHGVTDRLEDALRMKRVQQGVRESVETGIGFGADKWYHNEPVRQAFIKELGPRNGPVEYERFIDMVAATSPRSDVPTNIRNASYHYMMSKKGLPEDLPYPYGHVAQNLHRQNHATVMSPEGWDIFKNTKPASFSQNLQGNLVPGTMDTHAFRNIGMRTRDPRFLETSVSAKYKQGTDPTKDTIVNRYGERDGDTVSFRPQQLHEAGRLKIKDALQIPYFWVAKPRANEYGAAEKLYSEIGRDFKLPTADVQGAAWAGAGGLTGLGTVPTHTFPQLLNERILYTARIRGEDPAKTLSDFIRKKAPLLSVGGAAAGTGAIMGGVADPSSYSNELTQ
jgi:hypothetical protein